MRPSEDDLIARYLAPLAGPGGLGLRDDAALATPRAGHDLVVTKDMLVAGVHFFADDRADAIARKALRVNLSDLAAKGAVPLGFLLGLAMPADFTESWLSAFVDGLGDDARGFACPLLGGDTVATPGPLTLSITAFGEVEAGRMVPRSGAETGDILYVSGTIGDAAIGLRLRRAEPPDAAWIGQLDSVSVDALCDRYLLPRPRLGLQAALRKYATAAMDVSDGLVGDLGKMLGLAGVSTTIATANVPLSPASRAAVVAEPALFETAITGGDDYEILCAVPPSAAATFEAMAKQAGIEVTRLGVVSPGTRPPAFLDRAGRPLAFARGSFRHFEA